MSQLVLTRFMHCENLYNDTGSQIECPHTRKFLSLVATHPQVQGFAEALVRAVKFEGLQVEEVPVTFMRKLQNLSLHSTIAKIALYNAGLCSAT